MDYAYRHMEGNPARGEWDHYIATADEGTPTVWYVEETGVSIVEYEVLS